MQGSVSQYRTAAASSWKTVALSRPRRPVRYNLGTAAVAAAMVLLPLLYVGLLAALAWLVATHAVRGLAIFDSGVGRVQLALYLGPLLVGSITWLFLIKPLFSRAPDRPDRVVLDPRNEPELYAHVYHLADLLRAPRPREIRVNCDVNASAAFRRGVFSFFGNDLVLTIGTPLLAGMSLRQLTGVLAHELGHFAQGGAMRVSYVIRAVNWWFARVVYQRDRLDEWLDSGRNSSHVMLVALSWCARGMVGLSRAILRLLMQVGVLISSFQLRQMEFDADQYETLVAGSDAFAATARRLHELAAGQAVVGSNLLHFLRRGALPDSVGELIAVEASRLDPTAHAKRWAAVLESRTEPWATHPSDAERIAAAAKLGSEGVIAGDADAGTLLSNPQAVHLAASREFYAHSLGTAPEPEAMANLAEYLALKEGMVARGRAMRRYMPTGCSLIDLVVRAQVGPEPLDVQSARAGLVAARDEIQEAALRGESAPPGAMSARLELCVRLGTAPESSRVQSGLTNDESAAMAALATDAQNLKAMLAPSWEICERMDAIEGLASARGGTWTEVTSERVNLHGTAIVAQFDSLAALVAEATGTHEVAQEMLKHLRLADARRAVGGADQLQRALDMAGSAVATYSEVIAMLVEHAETVETALGLGPLETPAAPAESRERPQ